MHRFFLTKNFQETMDITGPDAHHISKVLRMQVGDTLQIVSLDQICALMKIQAITSEQVTINLVEKIEENHEPSVKIILAQGLPKSDKMDVIVQKAVELGVSVICPVAMENSVVRLDTAKGEKKQLRWQKIAAEAAKQSKRDIVPQVMVPTSLTQILNEYKDVTTKIVAYEVEDKRSLKEVLQKPGNLTDILLLIGPEGGISKEELELAQGAGMTAVSLGRRILRTETAGLAAIAAILYETGNLGG